MATTTLTSLTDVFDALSDRLGGPLSLGPVITRVLLRTGVNLRTPRFDQINDPAVVGQVLTVLREMGYPLAD